MIAKGQSFEVADIFPDFRRSPEANLWCAVIFTAIEDAERILWNAANVQNALGFVSDSWNYELYKVEKDVKADWFKEICLWVDVDQSRIVELIERLKANYKYNEMNFVRTK